MRFAVLLFISLSVLQGCGYSLRMVDVEEDRRQNQHKTAVEDQVSQLQAEVQKLKTETRQGIADVQKRRADADLRIEETTLALRLIQGKMEKDTHRFTELSHQMDDATFRMGEQGKKLEAMQKTLQQIDGARAASQKSLDTLSGRVATLDDHEKRLRELSALVSELTQKVPPLLNTQSAQLDELGKQIQKLSQGGEVEQLNKELLDLSNALDLLGQKITAKIDEQDRILNKTTKRLESLEAKAGSKGKRSAQLEPGSLAPEERPLCAEHEETCWKKTRRIHFVDPISN